MMILIVVISFLVFSYSIVRAGVELYKHFDDSIKSELNDAHNRSHISMLISLFLANLCFMIFLFNRGSFEYVLEAELIKRSMWILIMLIAYLNTQITRHLRKERIGEDYNLSLRREVRRAFGFNKADVINWEVVLDLYKKGRTEVDKGIFISTEKITDTHYRHFVEQKEGAEVLPHRHDDYDEILYCPEETIFNPTSNKFMTTEQHYEAGEIHGGKANKDCSYYVDCFKKLGYGK